MTPEVSFDWAEIIGRFHPALVHLPIGLVFGAALIELFGFGEVSARYIALRRTTLVACALCAGVTANSGWFLARSGGYDPDLLGWHRWLGVALAVLLGLAALADLFGSSGFWRRAALLIAMLLVVVTGHQGGSLTHGASYLTRDVPEWLRKAVEAISPLSYRPPEAGADEEPAPGPEAGTDTEVDTDAGPGEPGEPGEPGDDTKSGAPAPELSSDSQIVLEVLERRCIRCHGPEKSKAGLRLDQREGLLSVVEPGAAPDSELFRRVNLPALHGDEMPPDGPPLEDGELASLRRWINAGAQPLRAAPEPGD